MENYKSYFKRLHALSHIDTYLISMGREDVYHLQKHTGKGHMREKWRQGLNQFVDYLFQRNEAETLGDKTLIATKNNLTFCARLITLDDVSYFLILGPFCLKNENNHFLDNGLRQFSMEELEGFLPLFSKLAMESVVPVFGVNYGRIEKEEGLILEETICYNDDAAILSNAQSEKSILAAVKTGDLGLLIELQKNSVFSEPGHYEVGNGLRKEKNIALVMNTLTSRAAEEGGASVVYIRSLCAAYAAKIEQAKEASELYQLRCEIPQIYCRKVKENRMNQYSMNVKKCVSYIEIHLSKEIRLDQLAEFCSVSYEHLSRQIKKECGCSFACLLNQIRITRAQNYLAMGIPVFEVAEKTGYKTTSHFCHAFKNQTGMTTTEWCEKTCSR